MKNFPQNKSKIPKKTTNFSKRFENNRLYSSLIYDYTTKDKEMKEVKRIFEKFLNLKTVNCSPMKKKEKNQRKNTNLSHSPEPNLISVYKPLRLKCNTPTFTLKKSVKRKSDQKVYSLLGTKIQKPLRKTYFPRMHDASTDTS